MPSRSYHILQNVPSFSRILLLSSILRLALIVYSEWHDAHSVVKYTDVDYRVFSDAARFVLNPAADNRAEGPLASYLHVGRYGDAPLVCRYDLTGLCSPYTRATYRYTPLLAVLLTPNEWLHPSFGKLLFAGCDILAGLLMYELLVSFILPRTRRRSSQVQAEKNPSPPTPHVDADSTSQLATFLVSLHLLNPLVFTISTRGSSESVLSLFVLATLYYALKNRWDVSAVLLGLSTHWKIYPFIYGVACLGVIGGQGAVGKGWQGICSTIVNGRTIRFGVISATTFLALGAVMYAM